MNIYKVQSYPVKVFLKQWNLHLSSELSHTLSIHKPKTLMLCRKHCEGPAFSVAILGKRQLDCMRKLCSISAECKVQSYNNTTAFVLTYNSVMSIPIAWCGNPCNRLSQRCGVLWCFVALGPGRPLASLPGMGGRVVTTTSPEVG